MFLTVFVPLNQMLHPEKLFDFPQVNHEMLGFTFWVKNMLCGKFQLEKPDALQAVARGLCVNSFLSRNRSFL